MLFPATHGYNSYFDKDEKSIGGLKNPPPVSIGLYYVSLLLDGAAIIIAYLKVSLLFSVMILIFGLVSKAYSHPSIRLKKYPVLGWLTVGVFQGCFVFIMSYVGINSVEIEKLMTSRIIIPASLTTVMLLGSYPMTQVYQHEEDEKHGDKTISRFLGIRGTFIFAHAIFALATISFIFYFDSFFRLEFGSVFLLSLIPVVLFMMIWSNQVWKDSSKADYARTMWLNFISATCLNIFFIYFLSKNDHIVKYLILLLPNCFNVYS